MSEVQEMRRVVVIDDDEDMRSLIEILIAVGGRFRVVGTGADGHEGVAVATRLQPDVVILDLEMPHLDGLGAIPLIRERVPNAVIVVFSAFPDPYTLLDVLELGADAYLDKAGAWQQLVEALDTLCASSSGVA